jgi:hypothetical protein
MSQGPQRAFSNSRLTSSPHSDINTRLCSTSSPSVLEKTNSCAYGARRIPSSSATITLGFVDKALGHRAKKNRIASSVRPFTCRERERERERKERDKETESGRERYRHTQMHTDTQLKRERERNKLRDRFYI